MKDNVKEVHFGVKSKSVQSLIFIQIMFETCAAIFYFDNSEVGTKTTHCMKSVQIQSFFGPNTGKYGPEKNCVFGHFSPNGNL